MYYALFPCADDEGDMMGLIYKKDHPSRSFVRGRRFQSDPSTPVWERPPQEPIILMIKEGREEAPLPSFLREPVPLMSRKLLECVRTAGVDNLDVYRAELRFSDGRLAADDYYVFNLIGMVKAADLAKSTFDPSQPDRSTAMIFDSLTIDEKRARDLLMFRMEENVTTVIVHERVKQAIEAAGIELLNVDPTEDVAIL